MLTVWCTVIKYESAKLLTHIYTYKLPARIEYMIDILTVLVL